MFLDELHRAVEQLLGRAGGPTHIRLIIQPILATIFAIRAGLRDARKHKPPFLREFMRNKAQRRELMKTVWKDIGVLLITAFSIDSLYQLFVFKTFYLLQAIIVTLVLALLPYVIFRGLITRLRRRFRHF